MLVSLTELNSLTGLKLLTIFDYMEVLRINNSRWWPMNSKVLLVHSGIGCKLLEEDMVELPIVSWEWMKRFMYGQFL